MNGEPLSAAGQRRRDTMLEGLVDRMQEVHRTRRRRRAAAGTLVLMAGTVVLSMLALPGTPRSSVVHVDPAPSPTADVAEEAGRPRMRVEIVRTDPTIAERYAVRSTSRVIEVDDESLLAELTAIERPTGLIRSGGRVWLTGDVVGPSTEG